MFYNNPLLRKANLGVGLRSDHLAQILHQQPPIDFLEIHPENFLGQGPELEYLIDIAKIYPISFHCVSLSLGSSEGVPSNTLEKIKNLAQIINPFIISDHVSWSIFNNAHIPALIPLPYNNESIKVVCDNIKNVQDTLGRNILIENPAPHIKFKSAFSEEDFINEICDKTGCGMLLDINNLYVSSCNHKFDPHEYLRNLNFNNIYEYHIAGHDRSQEYLLDSHDTHVSNDVWKLYEHITKSYPPNITLLEWDKNLPTVEVLIDEVYKAKRYKNVA